MSTSAPAAFMYAHRPPIAAPTAATRTSSAPLALRTGYLCPVSPFARPSAAATTRRVTGGPVRRPGASVRECLSSRRTTRAARTNRPEPQHDQRRESLQWHGTARGATWTHFRSTAHGGSGLPGRLGVSQLRGGRARTAGLGQCPLNWAGGIFPSRSRVDPADSPGWEPWARCRRRRPSGDLNIGLRHRCRSGAGPALLLPAIPNPSDRAASSANRGARRQQP
jgi:hypothetical protein